MLGQSGVPGGDPRLRRVRHARDRAVLACLQDLDTTSADLADHQIDDDTDVAVVSIEEFTELERSILPDKYEEIDPFTDEPFDHPPLRMFDSPAAIVDTVLDSVTPENADRVAIVLDRGSGFSPLVEAALEAEGIPFSGGPGFVDEPDHRAFLRLLRAANAGSDVRIAEVRPILERLGADVDIEHNAKRLHAVDLPAVDWLTDFCSVLEERTFEEAIDEFETATDVDLDAAGGDRVEIFDFKTDRGRHAESEYRKQLSVYYHVLDRSFPDRSVTASLFYTAEGEAIRVELLSIVDLGDLLMERRSGLREE